MSFHSLLLHLSAVYGGSRLKFFADEPPPDRKTKLRRYWDGNLLQQAMKTGKVIRCNYRVNPTDRSQGFGSLEGLPADIYIQVLLCILPQTRFGLLPPSAIPGQSQSCQRAMANNICNRPQSKTSNTSLAQAVLMLGDLDLPGNVR